MFDISVMSEPTTSRTHGVYCNPASKNLDGCAAWTAWTGVQIREVLDFTPQATWGHIGANSWMLAPYTDKPVRLEVSLPMLPDDGGTLAEGAAGAYDETFRRVANNLMMAKLPNAIVRPGWEFNGGWYRWNAIGKADAYARYFRRIVEVMRSVPGQQFLFDWNPVALAGGMKAELAWPGPDVVDFIGIDVYDVNWWWYPQRAGYTMAKCQDYAWRTLQTGDRGLDWWARFAAAQSKRLAITELGITWRSDGHGGGDNPRFIDRMFDWMSANNVAYWHYFNCPDSPDLAHDLSRPDTRFPLSAARLKARVAALGAV